MDSIDVMMFSYSPVTGWRVASISRSRYTSIAVVKIGSLKLLRVPIVNYSVPGRFCNPRKLLGV